VPNAVGQGSVSRSSAGVRQTGGMTDVVVQGLSPTGAVERRRIQGRTVPGRSAWHWAHWASYSRYRHQPAVRAANVFSIDNGAVRPTPSDVYGVISLVFWSITLVVSVKYVVFVLRRGQRR